MSSIKEVQLTYIKGLMCDLDQKKVAEVEDKFSLFTAFIRSEDELEAIGNLVIAKYAIEQGD